MPLISPINLIVFQSARFLPVIKRVECHSISVNLSGKIPFFASPLFQIKEKLKVDAEFSFGHSPNLFCIGLHKGTMPVVKYRIKRITGWWTM